MSSASVSWKFNMLCYIYDHWSVSKSTLYSSSVEIHRYLKFTYEATRSHRQIEVLFAFRRYGNLLVHQLTFQVVAYIIASLSECYLRWLVVKETISYKKDVSSIWISLLSLISSILFTALCKISMNRRMVCRRSRTSFAIHIRTSTSTIYR